MKLQAEWRDRLRYWSHALTQDFYIPLGNIDFEGFVTAEQLSCEAAQKGNFVPMPAGTQWGMEWEYAWLRSKFTLPEAAAGKTIVMNIKPGNEATIFVNGKEFGTRRGGHVSDAHHYFSDNFLAQNAKPGTTYDILLEAYAGHYFPQGILRGVGVGPVMPGSFEDPKKGQKRVVLEQSTFGIWNEAAYQLWLDVTTLAQIMAKLPDGSLRAAKIAKGLKDFMLAVDFEQPAELREKDYLKGREILRPLMEAKNGSTAPTMYGIGNAHLDVVWLWPFQETIRKTARTFAQQLRLIEKYPGYKFLQSQPQTYQMCKEHYPELYARIQQAVKDGGWVVEGGMWVEPDTNMASGESLIRQLIYGLKFFKEEFGVDCEVLWLPDTFGYSAVLPQILISFGMKYLVTQKIFWSYNEGEQFPYHYFTWQGNDGTEITSFLPTSYTYDTCPNDMIDLWDNRVQKDEMDKFLVPYGYGDGGGGPPRDYIEFAQRQADIEGSPKFKMAHPSELFKDLEADGGPVHKYVGELYFTAHRGVFTSQASVKNGNRRSEFALREAELWASLASAKGLSAYPAARFEEAWKKVLLNQFHDILPGSSIARVYKEAAVLHNEVIADGGEIAAQSAAALAGKGDSISIFNSFSWEREAIVELPGRFAKGAVTAEGNPVAVELDGQMVRARVTLPACGCLVLKPAQQAMAVPAATASKAGETFVLENSKIKAVINSIGEITSFVNKASGREFVSAGKLNRFTLFKDVPRCFDAWDIDSMYEEDTVEIESKADIAIEKESGLSASVKISKKIGNSTLSQIVGLDAESEMLTFDTTVDWKELHRLLKVNFDSDVKATEAINEIQFGYVKHPTHRSRQYDKDRFEVCNHRYTALCDAGHGIAVLNDCKYGVSALEGTVGLTLLKAAGSPEMRADNRTHRFTYAFTAWEGSFEQSQVVRRGYELNQPVLITDGGSKSESFFSVSKENLIIETVKLAEDGSGDLIVRLYEALGASVAAELRWNLPIKKASLCEMNEQPVAEIKTDGNTCEIAASPFKVITLRLGR